MLQHQSENMELRTQTEDTSSLFICTTICLPVWCAEKTEGCVLILLEPRAMLEDLIKAPTLKPA